MKPLRLASLAASLLAAATLPCASAWAADAPEPLPLRYKLRTDWIYAHYGKDVYDCWNDGVAARCGATRNQLEGETEGRLMFEHELDDVLELRLQVGAEAYHNNGWTERSARATGQTTSRPRWVAHLFDTWVGLNHVDYGTVRVGTGLNPFQQASGQIDGNTDLGGKELLERMIAYDSPLLWGDKATGASLSMALYDGARYRKARLEQAPEDKSRHARARGLALLLDGTYNGTVAYKLAAYTERYGARKYYGNGPLDGVYELTTGATATSAAYNEDNTSQTTYLGHGATARSRGLAADVSYQNDTFRLGGELMLNRRLRTRNLTVANFESDGYGTGYQAKAAAVYFSTWHGPWSLWSKASFLQLRLTDASLLSTSSDWVYANSTQDVVKASGEVAYALTEQVKAVVGLEWFKRDFKESPLAQGMCATGRIHACYDPRGVKVFTGVRSNF